MIEIRLDGEEGSYQGSGPVTIGREPGNTLTVADPQISRFHLEIFQRGRDWIVRDLESRNGTINAATRARISEAVLRPGDALLLGSHRIEVYFEVSVIPESGSIRFEIIEPVELAAVIESDRQNITIGRYPTCEVVLSDPTVSRVHAVVTLTSAGYVLNDQKATNAIFVGTPPRRVTSELLHDGDEIRLGAVRLRVQIPEGIGEESILPELTEATGRIEIIGERPRFELIQSRLVKSALFGGFGTDDWRLLLSGYERDPELRVEHCQQGDVVFEAGEFDPYFRIVLSGEVEAFPDEGSTPLFRYAQGDCFGHIETKRALPRLAKHVASQDSMM
ncbi:MAG: FHA domain-containing protein, partial [Myxococcota bacterium]